MGASNSPCMSYANPEPGRFGRGSCGSWGRIHSATKVELNDLPRGISLRCNSVDNIHLGFDRANARSNSYSQPYGNIECKSGAVTLAWHANMVDKSASPHGGVDIVTMINADRSITFHVGGTLVHTSSQTVPESAFPLEYAIAVYDSSGYVSEVKWVNSS